MYLYTDYYIIGQDCIQNKCEDEKMERLAELREKAIRDEKALYNTGIREGQRKNKIEVIKKMLQENLNKDLIKKITNATDEEIEQAREEK